MHCLDERDPGAKATGPLDEADMAPTLVAMEDVLVVLDALVRPDEQAFLDALAQLFGPLGHSMILGLRSETTSAQLRDPALERELCGYLRQLTRALAQRSELDADILLDMGQRYAHDFGAWFGRQAAKQHGQWPCRAVCLARIATLHERMITTRMERRS